MAPKTGVRQVKNFDLATWNLHSQRLMWVGTLGKFSQDAALRTKLMETGAREVAEATTDPVWGIGYTLERENILNRAKWVGENEMGKLLMRVRAWLRANPAAAY